MVVSGQSMINVTYPLNGVGPLSGDPEQLLQDRQAGRPSTVL